jgi:phosphohistidine phosphatase
MPRQRTLFLVRHAPAEERGEKWPDDSRRPLTPAGVSSMRRIVRGLRRFDVEVDLILTSPFERAARTAEVLSAGLPSRADVIALPALAPGTTPERTAAALGPYGRHSALALVGHEPDLGRLAGWLIGANTPLVFKKGGVCRIDLVDWPPGRTGQLIWLATPKMLRD